MRALEPGNWLILLNTEEKRIYFSLPYGIYEVLWEADMQRNLCPTWVVNQNSHEVFCWQSLKVTSTERKNKKYKPCSVLLVAWCDCDKAAGYQTGWELIWCHDFVLVASYRLLVRLSHFFSLNDMTATVWDLLLLFQFQQRWCSCQRHCCTVSLCLHSLKIGHIFSVCPRVYEVSRYCIYCFDWLLEFTVYYGACQET